jgi:hypothetical protein
MGLEIGWRRMGLSCSLPVELERRSDLKRGGWA